MKHHPNPTLLFSFKKIPTHKDHTPDHKFTCLCWKCSQISLNMSIAAFLCQNKLSTSGFWQGPYHNGNLWLNKLKDKWKSFITTETSSTLWSIFHTIFPSSSFWHHRSFKYYAVWFKLHCILRCTVIKKYFTSCIYTCTCIFIQAKLHYIIYNVV